MTIRDKTFVAVGMLTMGAVFGLESLWPVVCVGVILGLVSARLKRSATFILIALVATGCASTTPKPEAVKVPTTAAYPSFAPIILPGR